MTAPVTGDAFTPDQLRTARQHGTIYPDGPVIVIREQALQAILDFSEQDPARERGGFLLGGVYGRTPQFVLVRHFHPALEAHGRLSSLTFTHETWANLTRQVAAHYSDETLVGWQHTHPGFGVFLSANDLFIHENFFSQPWQIALVVDPRRQELGFFHWRQGEIHDCGFVCARE